MEGGVSDIFYYIMGVYKLFKIVWIETLHINIIHNIYINHMKWLQIGYK